MKSPALFPPSRASGKGPFKSAWWKGYYAYRAEKSIFANPYPDYRTKHKNGPTFSRGFRNAWRRGFYAAKEEKAE